MRGKEKFEIRNNRTRLSQTASCSVTAKCSQAGRAQGWQRWVWGHQHFVLKRVCVNTTIRCSSLVFVPNEVFNPMCKRAWS